MNEQVSGLTRQGGAKLTIFIVVEDWYEPGDQDERLDSFPLVPVVRLVTNPNIRPELTLAGSMRVVCRDVEDITHPCWWRYLNWRGRRKT